MTREALLIDMVARFAACKTPADFEAFGAWAAENGLAENAAKMRHKFAAVPSGLSLVDYLKTGQYDTVQIRYYRKISPSAVNHELERLMADGIVEREQVNRPGVRGKTWVYWTKVTA